MIGALITFCLVGCLIILLSCLIKYKKQAYLISGYDEDSVADKDGFCNWIGGVMIWPGIISIITGFLLYYRPDMVLLTGLSFGVFTIAACIIATVGAKKFKK